MFGIRICNFRNVNCVIDNYLEHIGSFSLTCRFGDPLADFIAGRDYVVISLTEARQHDPSVEIGDSGRIMMVLVSEGGLHIPKVVSILSDDLGASKEGEFYITQEQIKQFQKELKERDKQIQIEHFLKVAPPFLSKRPKFQGGEVIRIIRDLKNIEAFSPTDLLMVTREITPVLYDTEAHSVYDFEAVRIIDDRLAREVFIDSRRYEVIGRMKETEQGFVFESIEL